MKKIRRLFIYWKFKICSYHFNYVFRKYFTIFHKRWVYMNITSGYVLANTTTLSHSCKTPCKGQALTSKDSRQFTDQSMIRSTLWKDLKMTDDVRAFLWHYQSHLIISLQFYKRCKNQLIQISFICMNYITTWASGIHTSAYEQESMSQKV